jgi:hypothetical protein
LLSLSDATLALLDAMTLLRKDVLTSALMANALSMVSAPRHVMPACLPTIAVYYSAEQIASSLAIMATFVFVTPVLNPLTHALLAPILMRMETALAHVLTMVSLLPELASGIALTDKL